MTKLLQRIDRGGFEISIRDHRIGLPLAPQKSPDVAPIFPQQGVPVIFRVTLEEYKKAVCLLDERVDAGLRRSGQNGVIARGQRLLRQARSSANVQPVSGAKQLSTRREAKPPCIQIHPTACPRVDGGRCRPCGERRHGRRGRTRLSIWCSSCAQSMSACERLPIRLLCQQRSARLCPGDDQCIQLAVPKLIETAVAAIHVPAHRFASRLSREAKTDARECLSVRRRHPGDRETAAPSILPRHQACC